MEEDENDYNSDRDAVQRKAQRTSVNSDFVPYKSNLLSCRHVLAFVAFLGFINVYCLRVNLSVALVAMVNQSIATGNATESNISDECPNYENRTVHHGGEMNWNSNKQAQVLAAFFYGYIVTQVTELLR